MSSIYHKIFVSKYRIPPQKIPGHSTEPFSRYELMKTFPVKMVILEKFWQNLHKSRTAQYFLKRLPLKFFKLLPLQYIVNWTKSKNLDWADPVVASMEWLIYILQFGNEKNLLDFTEKMELTRILYKDSNSSESIKETNKWSIETKQRKKIDCTGIY